jgi:Domain of unknown function (DUF5655)/Domain of unknown function (DUF4287)
MSKTARESIYDVHPGVAMMQKWVAELQEKTGRPLEEWIALLERQGPATEKDRRDWLRCKHGLGTNSAWWIAARAEGKDAEDDSPDKYLEAAERYVDQQYAGPKARLRPIFNELLKVAKALGEDVRACPCKTIVPLYREHVFAQIKPTTKSRVDLGLALAKHKGKLSKLLIDTGGLQKKDRITHRIALESVTDINNEVRNWLKAAYDLNEK